jgi:drug/metabolite transporter (DMT)-like permease
MNKSTSHHPALPWIMFIALAMIWGSSFILMKRGLQSFTYTQVGTMRVSIAALFMTVVGFRHFKHFRKKDLVALAIVGFLGNAIPYVLFPLAVNHLDSGVVGIINSLVPLFTVLIGGWFFGQKATGTQWQGVAVGLIGAAVLILPVKSMLNGAFQIEGELGYGLFGVLATLMYGISVNTLKMKLPHLKAVTVTTLSLATAAPFTIGVSLASGVTDVLAQDPDAWTNLGYVAILGVVGSGVAVILFNRLIQMTTALFSSSVTYAIPVVAILWGIWDGEQILWNHMLGLGIIVTGIYLVNKRK